MEDAISILKSIDASLKALVAQSKPSPRIPFGKNQGMPLNELEDGSLGWYWNAARVKADEPGRYQDKNKSWFAACEAERVRRGIDIEIRDPNEDYKGKKKSSSRPQEEEPPPF